jgi:hypothetical protein
VLGSSQLLVGGKGFCLGLLDLRCLVPISDSDNEGDEKSQFTKIWGPNYPSFGTGRAAVTATRRHNSNEVSVSG